MAGRIMRRVVEMKEFAKQLGKKGKSFSMIMDHAECTISLAKGSNPESEVRVTSDGKKFVVVKYNVDGIAKDNDSLYEKKASVNIFKEDDKELYNLYRNIEIEDLSRIEYDDTILEKYRDGVPAQNREYLRNPDLFKVEVKFKDTDKFAFSRKNSEGEASYISRIEYYETENGISQERVKEMITHNSIVRYYAEPVTERDIAIFISDCYAIVKL